MSTRLKIPGVYRDNWGMKWDPTKDSMNVELKKLTVLQKRSLDSNMMTDNHSIIWRQNKINILVKAIWTKKLWKNV